MPHDRIARMTGITHVRHTKGSNFEHDTHESVEHVGKHIMEPVPKKLHKLAGD